MYGDVAGLSVLPGGTERPLQHLQILGLPRSDETILGARVSGVPVENRLEGLDSCTVVPPFQGLLRFA